MDKSCVVLTHKQILTNWVSGNVLQPSNDPVVANISVPSISKLECQVSGLGTVHPFLTLTFSSTRCGVVT